MLYDATCCANCVKELRDTLVGGRIREVCQPGPLDLCLRVQTAGHEQFLCASADAQFARVHLDDTACPTGSERAFPFLVFARKHLIGAAVSDVRQVDFDRIVRVEVEPTNPRLVEPVRAIMFEIMGKHSNVILLDNVGIILETMKHITRNLSRVRTVLAHEPYIRPPFAERLDPRELTAERVRELLSKVQSPTTLTDWLRDTVEGMSPVLVREVLHRASVDAGDDVTRLGVKAESLAGVLADLGEMLSEERSLPTRHVAADGATVVYPFPLRHLEATHRAERLPALGPALGATAAQERAQHVLESQRSSLLAAVHREVERREARLERLRDTLARASEAERQRQIGNLLLAHLHLVTQGMSQVSLPDLYGQQPGTLDIPLDPKLSPQANAERYFRRSRSLEGAARHAPRQVAAVEEDVKRLQEIARAARETGSPEQLHTLSAELRQSGLVRPEQAAAGGAQPGADADERLLRFTSPNGYTVLVGRSAAESDEILRHVAAPDDLWFHARDIHGGHVVVRTDRQPGRVPPATIEFAAQIAAHFSKARHSSLVPVDYTLKKHVRKARRGPPGLHIYENAKTTMVEPRLPSSTQPGGDRS